MGRVVVPARLLRRRVAARFVEQPRVPDRLDRTELVRPLRGRRSRRAPAPRWTRWTRGWFAATTGWSACSTRRSTPPRSTPATSRGTSRACGRTAGSTPTRPSGRPWPSPNSATPSARGTVWRLINPLAHGASPAAIETYKVEPYVVAADVYAVAPHVGRGGWTWYTGSAGWMYRLIVESLLGLRLQGDRLRVEPCLPADWNALHRALPLPRDRLSHHGARRAAPGRREAFEDGRSGV